MPLTKSFWGFCGWHISFSKQLEKHLKEILYPWTNRGQTVDSGPWKDLLGPWTPPLQNQHLFFQKDRGLDPCSKLLRLLSLKFNIQKFLEYPAFQFLGIVNFVLTEVIISVAPNFGKLYGRMHKIPQAFTRPRSGIKMAGSRKKVSAARFLHQLFFQKLAFPGSR